MRSHIRRHDPYSGKISSASSTSSLYDEDSYKDTTILFRESYCVAASDLAEQLHGSLNNLGALYDQVIGTGIMPTNTKATVHGEDGSGPSATTFEKGQLLFFTRALRPEETDRFTAAGFRFAPFNRVEAVIARTTQIPASLSRVHIAKLQEFAYRTSSSLPPKQGVYFVCLAALARVRGSFEVLVQKDKRDDLPDVQVTPHQLTPYQLEYLRNYDGWTAERFVKMIEWKDKYRRTLSNEEKSFVLLLRNALALLGETMGEDWFFDLVFSAQPIYMRYGATKAQASAQTTVFGFTRLLDIHHGAVKQPDRLALVNWEFIRLRQLYYPGCNDHGRMRHEVHAEFGPLVTNGGEGRASEERRRSIVKAFNRPAFLRRDRSPVSRNHSTANTDSCSERGLIMATTKEHPQFETVEAIPPTPKQPWGGILATTNTVIFETSKPRSAVEMKNMGPQVTATAVTQVKEPRSYVDALYAQAKSSQVPKPSPLP